MTLKQNSGNPISLSSTASKMACTAYGEILCGISISANLRVRSPSFMNPLSTGRSKAVKVRYKSAIRTYTGKDSVNLLLCMSRIPTRKAVSASDCSTSLPGTARASAHLRPLLFIVSWAQLTQDTAALLRRSYSAKFIFPSRSRSTAMIKSLASLLPSDSSLAHLVSSSEAKPSKVAGWSSMARALNQFWCYESENSSASSR